jgi:hypothetical protein
MSTVAILTSLTVSGDNIVTYQGQLAKNGTPYSGEAYLKIAMLTNGAAVWTHDGSGFMPPTGVITAQVSMGFYTVYLGDPAVTIDLPISLFNMPDKLSIRVWLATPGDGSFSQMVPDRPVTAAAMAINASAISGVTLNQLMQKWSNVVIVAKGGGDVTNIQAGITLASSLPDRSLVYVCPGRYQEYLKCYPYVDIIGSSREGVILESSGVPAISAVGLPQGSVRIQDMTIRSHGVYSGIGIFSDSGIFLDRLTIYSEHQGIQLTNGTTYADDIRVRTSEEAAAGVALHDTAKLIGHHLDISTARNSSEGILVVDSAYADLHDISIVTSGAFSFGYILVDNADAKVDTMQIATYGENAPGIIIGGAIQGGGWYNDILVKTYGGYFEMVMGSYGIYVSMSFPTFENFAVHVHSPSNSAGIYLEFCDFFPLFDDGTIRTHGKDSPGVYCLSSNPMFFHVNIAVEGWAIEDNWGPFPLPGPGCGVVSETLAGSPITSMPYLNNCIIMMGNASPSAYASGGSPAHMTPTDLKLYNCTCLDQVSRGPRWMGYSLDMDPAFPAGVCSLWTAHNRLKSPGGSGLGYPIFPAPDPTMFNMVITGMLDPQGNIPDFLF